VLLQVLLGLIFGKLLQFVSHVLVNRRSALARGREVVAVDAGLQRSLVAV
jgi:hypothetical protein